jgi:hypothetical protein
MYALTIHHTGSLELELATTFALDLTKTINRITQRVNYAAHVSISDWNGENLARAIDLHALLDASEFTKDNYTDLSLIKV